jgi:hypothetical protein
MNKKEMDKLRSSTLYNGEVLKVRYTGKAGNFFKGQIIDAVPRMKHRTGLPYPWPKWIVCDYYITDSDGDAFPVARERYGELYKGFEWVKPEQHKESEVE